MYETLGQRLDDPAEWFRFVHKTWTMATMLRFLPESKLLEHIGDEPVSFTDLAKATGITPDKLARIADFFAAEGLLELTDDGKVSHTKRSRYLRANMDGLVVTMHALDAGTKMTEALQQDKTPYEVRYGKPVFDYLAEQPEIARKFAGFMSFMTSIVNSFVFSNHEFRPFELAVDVGGSHGELLLELLSLHPGSKGVLFDLPEVTAIVADSIRAAEQGERVEIVAGDFFKSVPKADLYLLKMILHDWNDDECVKILGSIRAAIRPEGRIAVLDYVKPETPGPSPAYSLDIAMLVYGTGRERKRSEFEALFEASGFRLDRLTENPAGPCVIEAVPV